MTQVDSRTSLRDALSLLGAVRCAQQAVGTSGNCGWCDVRRWCWWEGGGEGPQALADPRHAAVATAAPCRADDLLAVEVLWTPEEEVRGIGWCGVG